MKEILKRILWAGICLFAGVNIFLLNVILHEAGHYAAAEHYNLNPEIEFNFENVTKVSFGFEGKTIASTSFIESDDENTMLAIVLMGPFANLILGSIFLFIWFFTKMDLKLIGLIGVIVSFSSFVMNLIPLEGADGALIFNFLIG